MHDEFIFIILKYTTVRHLLILKYPV